MNTFTKYQDIILEEWSNIQEPMHTIFNSLEPSRKEFHFIAGPPFPTGKPHLGHVAVETIKSTILNYKAMNGYTCTNQIGYDCHGLPIESIANRELGISTREELETIGLARFNAFCKEKIASFEGDWEPVYNRLGRWVNFQNTYRTMDVEYMESVWWAFAELYKKGLIYRGYKITPYSYALQSPLSNFEASQNYKEVDCRSVYVRFTISASSINKLSLSLPEIQIVDRDNTNVYIIIWTTTPWTLPANLALCVNAALEYEVVQLETGEIYIIGKDTWKNIGLKSAPTVLKTLFGRELVGIKYNPIFDTYIRLYYETTRTPYCSKWFSIQSDDYVKECALSGTGTGIVHLAPLFGEDDYRICKQQNIVSDTDMPYLEIIDENCIILNHLLIDSKYHGKLILDIENEIIKDLKSSHALVRTQQIRHEYPYCYRTDTPLIYRTCDSFYVDIQSIKSRMIELNRGINWIPDHVGSQRFHNWLEGAKDWCISRSRYFGTPIPIWQTEDGLQLHVISSIAELEELTGQKLNDIHPEYVNSLEFTLEGKRYTRVLDIFDCWFESGAAPFAQYHYPFNNENRIRINDYIYSHHTLCDFIAEGLDQTRGWFYTLLVLSTALFNVAPARNILTVGLVLDNQKRKISKKLGNYVDVEHLLETYGTDAIRLYVLQSGITIAEPLPFRHDDVNVITKTLFQFRNCCDFLEEHVHNMNNQGFDFCNFDYYLTTTNSMDLWIISYMNDLIRYYKTCMDAFNISKAVKRVLDCIEDITNWYVKFNRDRLKGKNGSDEWAISSSVLFHVIEKWIVLAAPFTPFLAEYIYKQLNRIICSKNTYSLMTKFCGRINEEIPLGLNCKEETEFITTFALLQKVARMVRAARMKTATHTSSKTPIKRLEICMNNHSDLEKIAICIDLIQAELNVIDIAYSPLDGNMNYRIIPNKALLGKKYKKQASEIYKALESISFDSKTDTDNITCKLADGQVACITPDEYTLEPVFSDNDIYDTELCILVCIDFTYNKEIESLAVMRRFISHIQQSRKAMGLHPWNPISIEVCQDDFEIVSSNKEYIAQRLDCVVNLNSSLQPTQPTELKFTLADEDDSRMILYMILRLSL
jgi:isoleucyl-tRNA synthetase